ncbi:hypothetical protein ACFQ9V_04320 [Leifsonia sp. NPDC056665]|uniref:hypothetical protein n=1 Tax=Leifsonia sp. NPDC056665 TaxID=3345901 RepID=UPI00367A313C
MKHVTFAEKSLLMGSAAADLLLNLMVESANTTVTEPNNHLAMGYMLERMQELNDPFSGIGESPTLPE